MRLWEALVQWAVPLLLNIPVLHLSFLCEKEYSELPDS